MTTIHDQRPAWQGPSAPIGTQRPAKAPALLGRRRRQQPMVAIAMLVAAVLFAGIGAWQFSSATRGEQILVAAVTIPAGSRLSPADVAVETVRIPSGLPHVAALYLDTIGKYWATSTISPGALLTAAQLADTAPSMQPTGLVGLVLSAQQHPATITPGERIECIFTGTSTPEGVGGQPVATPLGSPSSPVPFSQLVPGQEITTATIWQVPDAATGTGGLFSSAPSTPSNSLDITVEVPAPFAQTLAAAAAATQVAIVAAPGAAGS